MLARIINGSHRINRCFGEMDRLFDDVFGGFPRMTFGTSLVPRFPALNVWEDSDKVFVEAELPGIKLDDIELLVTGDELTISGARGEPQVSDVAYHCNERGTGRFCRALRLPWEVKANDVEATLRDGVLLVTIPKAEEARPRKVKVKVLPK